MLCGKAGFGGMQKTAVVQPAEAVGERGECASRRAVVVQLRQRGQPVGFADHQAAQLHDRLRKTARR